MAYVVCSYQVKELGHTRIGTNFTDFVTSESLISSTYVTFHKQCNGLVQIFKFLCAIGTKNFFDLITISCSISSQLEGGVI